MPYPQKGECRNTGKSWIKKGERRSRSTEFKPGMKKPLGAYVFPKGKEHPKWKGKYLDTDGYVLIVKPDHPSANRHGQIYEHRLIVEGQIGRLLMKTERVHHINGNIADNRVENLLVFKNHGYHTAFHRWGSLPPAGIVFDGRKHPQFPSKM